MEKSMDVGFGKGLSMNKMENIRDMSDAISNWKTCYNARLSMMSFAVPPWSDCAINGLVCKSSHRFCLWRLLGKTHVKA